jgi:flagellar basal-body rod protein FlgG
MRSMNIAATGMLAQQLNVEVISNNIANLNTTGFKRQRAEFQDLIYQTLRRAGADSTDAGTVVPAGVQIGVGVKAAAVYRITEQGNVTKTDNALDLAIQGRGFFQVRMADGTTSYTRAGSFQLSPTGEIVTADGLVIEPGITLPQDTTGITVNASGMVLAQIPGQQVPQNVGQLELANFANEAGMENIGDNLLVETAASGAPQLGVPGALGFGKLLQGFVETSNVNVVAEITNLITAQRAYEMNSKVIQVSDEMSRTLNNFR